MKFNLIPLLQTQRDLLKIPRGWERFHKYLQLMTGGSEDIVLPLPAFNPMSKDHVSDLLDQLIALDAENIAQKAVAEIEPLARNFDGELSVGIVVADDKMGGWTQRHLAEMSHKFEFDAMLARGWVVIVCWSSEVPHHATLREEALATLYRNLYVKKFGFSKTLGAMMRQEGECLAFAGSNPPPLDSRARPAIEATLRAHAESTDFPTLFTCLFGDAIASLVGYAPLGLPERAGFSVAVEDAKAQPLSLRSH